MMIHGTGTPPYSTNANASGSNSPANAPPPYSLFPDQPQQPRVTEGDAADLVLRYLANDLGYDQRNRTSVLERVIRIHNAMAENAADQLVLAGQDDFAAKFPKLNQWIDKKLSFLNHNQLMEFAFASGHFNEYSQAHEYNRGNLKSTITDFFQRYFSQEGLDSGVTKLDLLQSTNILYQNSEQLAKFTEVYSDVSCLEVIKAMEESADSSNFNFPAALPIARNIGISWRIFTISLGHPFNSNYADQTYNNCGRNILKTMLTILHDFSLHGRPTEDLIDKLTPTFIGRTDLSEGLAKALQRS